MSTTVSPSSPGAIARHNYLQHLVAEARKSAAASALNLPALRDRALAVISEQAFPSNRDEAWRFTDLAEMLPQFFELADAGSSQSLTENELAADDQSEFQRHLQALSSGLRLTTVNGFVNSPLSDAYAGIEAGSKDRHLPDGVVVSPLSELVSRPDFQTQLDLTLSARLGQIQGSDELFTALNTAGFSDVLVVWVPADVVVEQPICLVRAATGGYISHLRTLVIAERHSKLTLVESYWGEGDTARCNTSVTECWLADGAQLEHIRLQDESPQTYHLAKTAVSQGANSRYACTAIDLGAKLSRHHHEIYQQGPQTETHLHGLSAITGDQLADTHSLMNLVHPHGTATQVQKNIVDQQAHSVFNGRVNVAREAQLTDAAQLNRNLMLSSRARVDTKPELDIVADNVKCAHGATVSQLQADEIFYLQSRGITAEQAQRLLLYGFAMEIVDRVRVEALRDALSERLTQWSGS